MWNITDIIYHSSSLSSVSTPFNISLISIFLLPSLFSWCEIKSFYLTLKLNSSSWSFHLRHHVFASPGCTQANVYGCCLRDCVLFYTSSKFTSVFLLPRLLTGSWINIFFWQERSFTQQQVQEQSCWCSVVSYRSSLGCYSPSPGFWRQSRLWHTRQCVVVSCCRFSCRWNLLRHLLRSADGLHVHTGRFLLLLLVLTAAELHLENSLFPC